MEALDQFFIDFIQLFLQIEYLDEISFAFPQQSLCSLRKDVHSVINNLCYRSSHIPALLKRKEKHIGSHQRQAPVLNEGQGLWIWSRVTEIWCCAEPNPKQEPVSAACPRHGDVSAEQPPCSLGSLSKNRNISV